MTPAANKPATDRGREQPLADGGEAEGKPGEPDAGQDEALHVERRQAFLANVGDIAAWRG